MIIFHIFFNTHSYTCIKKYCTKNENNGVQNTRRMAEVKHNVLHQLKCRVRINCLVIKPSFRWGNYQMKLNHVFILLKLAFESILNFRKIRLQIYYLNLTTVGISKIVNETVCDSIKHSKRFNIRLMLSVTSFT